MPPEAAFGGPEATLVAFDRKHAGSQVRRSRAASNAAAGILAGANRPAAALGEAVGTRCEQVRRSGDPRHRTRPASDHPRLMVSPWPPTPYSVLPNNRASSENPSGPRGRRKRLASRAARIEPCFRHGKEDQRSRALARTTAPSALLRRVVSRFRSGPTENRDICVAGGFPYRFAAN
jgi:hypothetical protein